MIPAGISFVSTRWRTSWSLTSRRIAADTRTAISSAVRVPSASPAIRYRSSLTCRYRSPRWTSHCGRSKPVPGISPPDLTSGARVGRSVGCAVPMTYLLSHDMPPVDARGGGRRPPPRLRLDALRDGRELLSVRERDGVVGQNVQRERRVDRRRDVGVHERHRLARRKLGNGLGRKLVTGHFFYLHVFLVCLWSE